MSTLIRLLIFLNKNLQNPLIALLISRNCSTLIIVIHIAYKLCIPKLRQTHNKVINIAVIKFTKKESCLWQRRTNQKLS